MNIMKCKSGNTHIVSTKSISVESTETTQSELYLDVINCEIIGAVGSDESNDNLEYDGTTTENGDEIVELDNTEENNVGDWAGNISNHIWSGFKCLYLYQEMGIFYTTN